MSHHLRTAASAHWACPACQLSTPPLIGVSAVEEITLLATVHDRVHHGGARTAHLVLAEDLPTILPAAS